MIKWLEAALVDVPTAAVRNDEFCSVIRDGETGFLCGDEEEWRTALEKLIEDKELRKRIGEAARLEVIENYTTDTINEELIKLFGAG